MANKTFTEKQREIIARKLGYDGPMEGFEKFVRSSPAMEQKVRQLAVKLVAKGGFIKKFAQGGVATSVTQLYNELLGRTPDTSGGAFYTERLASGVPLEQIRAEIAASPEAQTKTAAPTTQNLTQQITQASAAARPVAPAGPQPSIQPPAPAPAAAAPAAPTPKPTPKPVATTPPPSAYVPRSGGYIGGSHKVGGVELVPGAPGYDLQKALPILKSELAPSSIGVQEYLKSIGEFDETAQKAVATRAQEDLTYKAFSEAFNKGQITVDQVKQVESAINAGTNPTAAMSTVMTNSNVTVPKVDLTKVATTSVISGADLKPTTTPSDERGDGPQTETTIDERGNVVNAYVPVSPTLPKLQSMLVSKIGTPSAGETIAPPTDITATTATPATAATAAQVTAPTATAAPTVDAVKAKSTVDAAVAGNEAVTGTLSSSAQAAAAETKPAETALKDLEAAKLTSPREVAGVPERTLQAGELVSGSAVNQSLIDAALIKAEAATAAVKPEMTVQGQLDKLLADFDSGNPPPWAASSLRNANAVMASRGLGASSLAGQAIVQATLEAAIPIAAQDAQTVTALELQNLSNRQQVAVLVAQQRAAFLGQEFDQAFQTRVVNAARVADIANLNFTAEQTIALENARLAQTVDLANLSNDQAVIMARAAQVANLESANLSNRQQAALQNAQAFLQLDLTNLNNEQQTSLFNAEKTIQAIFTDTAAENAAKQFNATSTMQVQQFYDSISTQVSQFNASQKNALEQFNVSQENAVEQFNAQQTNAVAQFNAQNRLIVDQSNAEWRRQISTIDTAAQNTANQFDAQAGLQINLAEYNNLWQSTRDTMEYAFKASEGYLDRQNTLAIAVLQKEAAIGAAKFELEAAKYASLGKLSASVFSSSGKDILGTVAGGGKAVLDLLKSLGPSAGPARPAGTGDVEDQPGGFYGNESVFTDSAMDFLGDYPMFFEDDAGGAAAGYDYWGGSD